MNVSFVELEPAMLEWFCLHALRIREVFMWETENNVPPAPDFSIIIFKVVIGVWISKLDNVDFQYIPVIVARDYTVFRLSITSAGTIT